MLNNNNTPHKCINFDWVQVWTYEPPYIAGAHSFREMGWVVKERSYGTRIFNEVLTLIDRHGIPFVEVCRSPKSKKGEGGIIQDNATSIRLVNQSCYSPSAINDLIQFMQDVGYSYKNGRLAGVQRLDICMDFTHFDVLEEVPQEFVNNYMSGKYSKVTQPRVRAVGVDGYIFKRYNSLSWGSPTSMVSTKLYCKTQEMEEVKEKPWIRQAWVDAGILADSLDETPVWRIEFKLTGECHEWVDEDGVVIHNTLESYASENNLMQYTRGLIGKYFDFRYVDPSVSKYKAEKVDMWRWPKGVGRALPRRKEHFRDTGRAELIMMNKLDRMREQSMTISDLSALTAVKRMVQKLYMTKKSMGQITANDIPHDDFSRLMEYMRAVEDSTGLDTSSTVAMIHQSWDNLSQAAERQTLFSSVFPSSRTEVQLSDFLTEHSRLGWFVTECNRLKQRWLQYSNEGETPPPILRVYSDLYPLVCTEGIKERWLRNWVEHREALEEGR